MDELSQCVRHTRRHLKALEDAQKLQKTSEGLQNSDISKLVMHALEYHRMQYDVWMQAKLDKFATLPWDEVPTPGSLSLTPSRTASLPDSTVRCIQGGACLNG